MKLANIMVQKIVKHVNGKPQKYVKVVGMACIKSMPELPSRYLGGIPNAYMQNGVLVLNIPSAISSPEIIIVRLNDVIPWQEFGDMLVWLRRAGTRLTKINRQIAEEKALISYVGEEVFEI